MPGAPDIFLNLQENPRLDVALDVNARKLQDEHPVFEVVFQVRADAKLADGRTAFIIAHRLSTVRQCDRICVIENGALVESGTHAELMTRPEGTYRRLAELQFTTAA